MYNKKDLYFNDMPLIVQKAFLLGPKFIYSNFISPEKVIDNLKKKRNTRMKALEQDELYHELQNTPQKNQKEHINPKLLEKNMHIWLEKIIYSSKMLIKIYVQFLLTKKYTMNT